MMTWDELSKNPAEVARLVHLVRPLLDAHPAVRGLLFDAVGLAADALPVARNEGVAVPDDAERYIGVAQLAVELLGG